MQQRRLLWTQRRRTGQIDFICFAIDDRRITRVIVVIIVVGLDHPRWDRISQTDNNPRWRVSHQYFSSRFTALDLLDDDDEIAYFTVRWETRKLVLSTAPKHEITPTETVKTENGPISRGSQSKVSLVRDLWRKRFTKKVRFEFRVKEWRSDGWGKWRKEGWIEVSIKRW